MRIWISPSAYLMRCINFLPSSIYRITRPTLVSMSLRASPKRKRGTAAAIGGIIRVLRTHKFMSFFRFKLKTAKANAAGMPMSKTPAVLARVTIIEFTRNGIFSSSTASKLLILSLMTLYRHLSIISRTVLRMR